MKKYIFLEDEKIPEASFPQTYPNIGSRYLYQLRTNNIFTNGQILG